MYPLTLFSSLKRAGDRHAIEQTIDCNSILVQPILQRRRVRNQYAGGVCMKEAKVARRIARPAPPCTARIATFRYGR
jgi:hypothetical protein